MKHGGGGGELSPKGRESGSGPASSPDGQWGKEGVLTGQSGSEADTSVTKQHNSLITDKVSILPGERKPPTQWLTPRLKKDGRTHRCSLRGKG